MPAAAARPMALPGGGVIVAPHLKVPALPPRPGMAAPAPKVILPALPPGWQEVSTAAQRRRRLQL